MDEEVFDFQDGFRCIWTLVQTDSQLHLLVDLELAHGPYTLAVFKLPAMPLMTVVGPRIHEAFRFTI